MNYDQFEIYQFTSGLPFPVEYAMILGPSTRTYSYRSKSITFAPLIPTTPQHYYDPYHVVLPENIGAIIGTFTVSIDAMQTLNKGVFQNRVAKISDMPLEVQYTVIKAIRLYFEGVQYGTIEKPDIHDAGESSHLLDVDLLDKINQHLDKGLFNQVLEDLMALSHHFNDSLKHRLVLVKKLSNGKNNDKFDNTEIYVITRLVLDVLEHLTVSVRR